MSATKNTVLPLPELTPREAYDKACHYDSTFKQGRKYFEYNYWGKVYQHLHPSHTQHGTEQRTRCVNVLKKALDFHLDTTFNGDERTKIMAAQREINTYK
jgi:hypothetical protein